MNQIKKLISFYFLDWKIYWKIDIIIHITETISVEWNLGLISFFPTSTPFNTLTQIRIDNTTLKSQRLLKITLKYFTMRGKI